MNWSRRPDLVKQLQQLWDMGRLLSNLVDGRALFPRRLTLKKPTSTELSERFDDARDWIAHLQEGAKSDSKPGYRLVMREIRHRVIGANALPDEIWIDTIDDALALIGKQRDAQRFASLVKMAQERQPALLAWLRRRPLRALQLANDWPALLDVVAWQQQHPRSGIYMRQIDLPGVNSKFLEERRSVLAELLDLALPSEAIDTSASGISGFVRRYGFRDKPVRVRFRLLDPGKSILATGTEQDFTVTHNTFAKTDFGVSQVFITENEINFLAFPPLADSLIVFGAGYGFDKLSEADWLHTRRVFYWGDIDTHGFAILDQLRAYFTHTDSFLMDRGTLLEHRSLWGDEPNPVRHALSRLTAEENALFDDLREDRLGKCVRLEQEKIGFGWLEDKLRNLEKT